MIRLFVRTSDLEMQPFCMRGEELPLPRGFPLALLGSLLPPLIYDEIQYLTSILGSILQGEIPAEPFQGLSQM